MSLSRADHLRQRAREVEDHAWIVRWSHPQEYARLIAISRELAEIADHLPPDRAE